jgi:geranylgeranyl transferase type-2 subunit beta
MSKDGFSQTSYLASLNARMRRGLNRTDTEYRARHVKTILSFQRDSGGFAGRRGPADLYYTGFAARALDALGVMEPGIARDLSAYLRRQKPNNIIDQLSQLSGLLLVGKNCLDTKKIFEFTEGFRVEDGGYAKARNGKTGSTYHTFLAALCYDLFGKKPPRLDEIHYFLKGQNRKDGGFCEFPSATHSSTNATAAGISTAELLGLRGNGMIQKGKDYLLSMRDSSGGWIASKHAPLPDLLSTYTALSALGASGGLDSHILVNALCFTKPCERSGGGFVAGHWDNQVDVEYTYYGLGILSLALEEDLVQNVESS